jgi:hypothetical protein
MTRLKTPFKILGFVLAVNFLIGSWGFMVKKAVDKNAGQAVDSVLSVEKDVKSIQDNYFVKNGKYQMIPKPEIGSSTPGYWVDELVYPDGTADYIVHIQDDKGKITEYEKSKIDKDTKAIK